jgi:hypothetical protein
LFRKRFTALIAAASALAGCTAPPATTSAPTTRPSAQLGTVAPAYPVGDDLAPDIEVIEAISVDELSTDEPVPLDVANPCASVPADAVGPSGVDPTPVENSEDGCLWHGSGRGAEIGALPYSMADEVEEHLAMATDKSIDSLAHLAWLRIDGHYAIERVLELDRTKSCWLTLDVSSTVTLRTVVYRIDTTTGEPAETDTDTSVRKVCPVTRKVAKNLLHHLDPQGPGWWEDRFKPTG